MEFEKGWYNKFSIFIDKIDQTFRRRKEDKYADHWQQFASYQMPQSELVNAYVSKHDIESPLGQYLYGSAKFASDEQFSVVAAATIESTVATGFSNEHNIRASAFDLDLMDQFAQNKQTIPWKGHREVSKIRNLLSLAYFKEFY
jgi:hypothetical protein